MMGATIMSEPNDTSITLNVYADDSRTRLLHSIHSTDPKVILRFLAFEKVLQGPDDGMWAKAPAIIARFFVTLMCIYPGNPLQVVPPGCQIDFIHNR